MLIGTLYKKHALARAGIESEETGREKLVTKLWTFILQHDARVNKREKP